MALRAIRPQLSGREPGIYVIPAKPQVAAHLDPAYLAGVAVDERWGDLDEIAEIVDREERFWSGRKAMVLCGS